MAISLNIVRRQREYSSWHLEGHRSSLQRIWAEGTNEEIGRGIGGKKLTTVLSVMAYNGLLPFPISSLACNRVDATSVDRISSFCRSRTGFLDSPDFHISPRSQSCCSPPLCLFPLLCCISTSVSLSLSLLLPVATTVTRDYGKAMRRDGDNGCIAYVRARDRRGGVALVGRRKWQGWREKDVRSKRRDR